VLATGAPALALPAGSAVPANVVINGSVDLLCGGAGLTTIPLDLSATNLADSNGFVNDNAYVNKQVTTPEIFCNGVNSTAAVTHVNLTDSAASGVQAPFTSVITFVPQVTIGSHTITGDGSTAVGLYDGTVTVTLLTGGPANTNLRPVAGNYAGSVSVTFTPAS
jgi:hypothetical protein